MKSKGVQVLVAIAALAAVVYGITQMLSGVDEMQPGKPVTTAGAREIADQAAANLKEFIGEEQGIAISHPKNWTSEKRQEQPFFTWKTLKGTVNGNIVVEELQSSWTLVEYVKAKLDLETAQMTKDKMPPKMLGREQMQVGGEEGLRVRVGYTYPDGNLELRCTQYYFLHGNRAYVITWTTPADVHESFDGLMAKMLAWVRFLG